MRKLALLLALLLPFAARAQISGAGNFGCSGTAIAGTAATSATANNTVLYSAVNIPAYAVKVQLDQTSTISTGAITFQQSDDGGANYITVPTTQVLNEATGAQLTNPYTLVASTNQAFLILLNGNSSFAVKLTTAITGSATVTPYVTLICQSPTAVQQFTFDASNNAKIVVNAALPAGTNLLGKVGIDQTTPGTTNAVSATNFPTTVDTNSGTKSASTLRMVLATDQPTMTNPQPVTPQINSGAAAGDTTHRQYILPYPDTTTNSYHASSSFAGSSTTDNAVMPGNATNTVLLNKITVTCTETTAGIVTLTLIKRSAADTGGTSASLTKVPDDANYTAAVSAPLTYTGTGPSVGAAVGNLDVAQFGCNATGTAGPNDIYIFRPMKPIILRGTAQQVAVNMGNAAITGGTLTVTFDWEETTTP